jgi:hypothetical protein
MKAGGGRAKGSGFEREVAAMILKHAGPRFTKADCFRTPLSGGHRFARESDPGDLQISPALTKVFPACVECKRYREISLEHFIIRKKQRSWQEMRWLDQTISQTKPGQIPILVFKANRGVTFCVVSLSALSGKWSIILPFTNVTFHYRNDSWVLMEFDVFLIRFFDGKDRVLSR